MTSGESDSNRQPLELQSSALPIGAITAALFIMLNLAPKNTTRRSAHTSCKLATDGAGGQI